jgi:protein TonB
MNVALKNDPLGFSLLASLVIHAAGLIMVSALIQHTGLLRRENLLPITLVDVPRSEKVAPPPEEKLRAEIKKPAPPPPKIERVKEAKPVAKKESVQTNQPATPAIPVKEEPGKTIETKSSVPSKPDIPPIPAPAARVEGGGSEAGAGNLFGKGDVGVAPGPGTAGGGGGKAASGLGRGSGAPGLPGQSPVLRTNREAKPIQTVKATYPPMALRMGMESDVTLKIEVDPDGRVTNAEITKSGGAGFDDEALKAVKQSRFEPAQKDGQNVPAEFIYIYRFRLQR